MCEIPSELCPIEPPTTGGPNQHHPRQAATGVVCILSFGDNRESHTIFVSRVSRKSLMSLVQ